jgi:hypothetical protein
MYNMHIAYKQHVHQSWAGCGVADTAEAVGKSKENGAVVCTTAPHPNVPEALT